MPVFVLTTVMFRFTTLLLLSAPILITPRPSSYVFLVISVPYYVSALNLIITPIPISAPFLPKCTGPSEKGDRCLSSCTCSHNVTLQESGLLEMSELFFFFVSTAISTGEHNFLKQMIFNEVMILAVTYANLNCIKEA